MPFFDFATTVDVTSTGASTGAASTGAATGAATSPPDAEFSVL